LMVAMWHALLFSVAAWSGWIPATSATYERTIGISNG